MTALVSLPFIAMIPIDLKLQIFPYTCYNKTSIRKISNFTVYRDHTKLQKVSEHGQSLTPADILVDI